MRGGVYREGGGGHIHREVNRGGGAEGDTIGAGCT